MEEHDLLVEASEVIFDSDLKIAARVRQVQELLWPYHPEYDEEDQGPDDDD